MLRSPFSSRHVNGHAGCTAEPCGRLAMQNAEKMFNETKGAIKKTRQLKGNSYRAQTGTRKTERVMKK